MTTADDDDGLAALLLEFEDIRLPVLGGAADSIEDQCRRKAGLQARGKFLELVGEHRRLGDHAHLGAEVRQRIDLDFGSDDMALALRVAEETNNLGVLGVAEDDGGIALAGMHAHLAGDDADVGAGGVAEFHAERLQVFAALGRDAVRAHNHDGSGIGGLRDL